MPSAGNWTWFELAILENESAFAPRVKDGVELVWKSHYNRFLSEEYGWVRGQAPARTAWPPADWGYL